VAIYHIIGVTPEAPTLEAAFQGDTPKEEVTITRADLDRMQKELSTEGGKIDFALFGCPHLTIKQVGIIADRVKGKKLAVPLWIMASSFTKDLARKMGYLDTLLAAGGDIAGDTCMDQPCWKFLYGKKGITDSPKCAYYTQRRNMAFVIRDIETCVDASLAGRV
jgi:predicted aconitase